MLAPPIRSKLKGLQGLIASARVVSRRAAVRAAALDYDGAFPSEDIADLGACGLLQAPLPDFCGGAGLGTSRKGAQPLLGVLRLLGWGNLSLGRLYEGHVNALALVARFGSPDQIAAASADVAAGKLFGVWNTEPEPGVRLARSDTHFVLHGQKQFASGAGFVERPLITAWTDNGERRMVLLALQLGERADLTGWQAHGMRASASGIVALTGIRVEQERIIGSDGDYQLEPFFSGGAWRFAAVQLGGIERLLDELRNHLNDSGRASDPHQLARVGEAALAAESARLWIARAAVVAEASALDRHANQVVGYVNLARLAVERAGLDVIRIVQRSIGLAGFMRSHPVEMLLRDLATYLRQPAPDRALGQAAAFVLSSEHAAPELWAPLR
jgi:alkylation response protein AidB-like acyl-CoA dehydrogenase